MWHHHSPDELQDKWGRQQTPRDYRKSEIQSLWGHSALAVPPLSPRRRLGNLQGPFTPCCWAIWLPKPQQRQRGWSLCARGSAAAPSAACGTGLGSTTMFATVRFGGRRGRPGTWATLSPPRGAGRDTAPGAQQCPGLRGQARQHPAPHCF